MINTKARTIAIAKAKFLIFNFAYKLLLRNSPGNSVLMSSAAKQAVNWTKVLAKCSPSVRKTILETRAHHEDLRRQIAELKESIPKLDFAAYRQVLPKEMGKIVAEAEGQFKAFKPAKQNVAAALTELEQERELKVNTVLKVINVILFNSLLLL